MAKDSVAFKQRARELREINEGKKGAHRLSRTNQLCEFDTLFLLLLFAIHRPNGLNPHAPLLLLRPRWIPVNMAQGRAMDTIPDVASAVRYPDYSRSTHGNRGD